MLSYKEIKPAAELSPFVKCFWSLRGTAIGGAQVERILPDGSFELVFHLGDPFHADGKRQPRAMLVGEIRRPTIVAPSHRVDVLGVRFRVGGAAAFVQTPAVEMRDRILEAKDFFPCEQVDQLFEIQTGNAAVMHLEGMLRQSLAPHRLNVLTRAAVGAIHRGRGSVRVRNLVSHLGTTERTLERAFKDSVGMGPKLLSRLVRFTHAISGDDDDLGYYDDPHRIHEFRAFSGVTPTAFRDEQNVINTAFVGNLQDTTEVAR